MEFFAGASPMLLRQRGTDDGEVRLDICCEPCGRAEPQGAFEGKADLTKLNLKVARKEKDARSGPILNRPGRIVRLRKNTALNNERCEVVRARGSAKYEIRVKGMVAVIRKECLEFLD